MLLSKGQIVGVQDLVFEEVDVPEWGGRVRVRALSSGERDQFELMLMDITKDGAQVDTSGFRARVVALGLVDAKGERLFSMEDAKVLAGKKADVISKLFKIIQRLSGLGPDSAEKAVEDFSAGQGDDSSSA